MKVRPKKSAPKHKGETAKPPAEAFTFPAPVRGWVLNENLATPQAGGAKVLDNFYCTPTGIRVRGGKEKYATLGGPVTAMFTYQAGGADAIFAATSTAVYNVTTIIDPLVIPTPVLTGQTSGEYSATQFGTAGGNFLVLANGTDAVRNWNGTAWTTPAITGVTSSLLTQVWAHGNRLFFIERQSLNAWYLPVDSIAGAASQIALAGVMNKGGYLVFGAKWSVDAGDGLDDKCVFVSSEGEVAVFQGANPSSAADWALVGLYQLPRPMGKNSHIVAGGDLLIATEIGLIPISAAVNRDIAALDQVAVSKPIAPYWQSQALDLFGSSWEMVKVPDKGIMLVSQPSPTSKTCLVVNLLTGGWSRFTGWDVQCLAYFVGKTLAGSLDSCIYLLNSGGTDSGDSYTCTYLGQADPMGLYGQQKTILQMRAIFSSSRAFLPQLTAQVDYAEQLSPPPQSPPDENGDTWDNGAWDEMQWDVALDPVVTARWTSIGKTGRVIAPELQLTFGVSPTPDTELVAIDAQFRAGAVVT